MGGGKGSQTAPPPVVAPQQGMDPEMMAMMMQMMQSQGAMQSYMPPMPNMAQAPDVISATKVDWAEKMDELGRKAAVDYDLETADRHGRMQTIHSMADEEDTTDESLLGE